MTHLTRIKPIICGQCSIQLGTTPDGGGDVSSSHGWHIEHLQHVATSVGGRRQRQSQPLVVVRRYKLHSRCSGQHVLIAGRHPTARAPLHSDYGNYIKSAWSTLKSDTVAVLAVLPRHPRCYRGNGCEIHGTPVGMGDQACGTAVIGLGFSHVYV